MQETLKQRTTIHRVIPKGSQELRPLQMRVPVLVDVSTDTIVPLDSEQHGRGYRTEAGEKRTVTSAVEVEIDLPAIVRSMGLKAFKNRTRVSNDGFVSVLATEKLA